MMKNYQNHAMTDAEARQALADACKQVETNLPLYTYQCQNHSSVNDIYPGCANNQWTCGFWPGEIWLAYEATGDEKFKTAALIQVDSFADRIARKVEVDHHDMGLCRGPRSGRGAAHPECNRSWTAGRPGHAPGCAWKRRGGRCR